MTHKFQVLRLLSILTLSMMLFACTAQTTDVDPSNPVDPVNPGSRTVINLSAFNSAGLVETPAVVDCTLTDGTATQCAQIIVKYLPDGFQTGPYCPETLADEGGIWNWDGDNAGLYRLNEDFFTMLTEQGFNFYDENGSINIADPGAGGGAGGADGGNSCLEASEDSEAEVTMLIPLEPVMTARPTELGTVAQVGVALNSIPIFADAPSVLATGNLPALDVCGGHIDPGGWYHWHATASDIESSFAFEGLEVDCHLEQSASDLFGYAFDGYPIYGSADPDGTIPTDLDACNGHVGATADYPEGIYHYHASLSFPNLPSCLVGVTAEGAFRTNASGGVGAPGGPDGGPGGVPAGGRSGRGEPAGRSTRPNNTSPSGTAPSNTTPNNTSPSNTTPRGPNLPSEPLDLSAAAKHLGVTETVLQAALGTPPFDLNKIAETLGVSVAELVHALSPHEH